MALGLLLQVFLLSVLLFSSSIGAPLKQTLQSRREDASVNLRDDDDDDDDDDTDDDGAEVNALPKVVLGEVPFHPLQLPGFLTNQNLLVKRSVPWVKEPINAQSGMWIKNGEKAFVFPLNSAAPLSNPPVPGSSSPLLNAVPTNNLQVPPFAYYPNNDVYYGWSWPGLGSVYGDVTPFNEGSTAKTGTPKLIYEQVFAYPAGSPHSTFGSSPFVSANYGQVGKGSGTVNPAAKDPQTIFSQVPGSPYPLKIYQVGNLNHGYIPLDKRITLPWQGPVINTQDTVVIQRLGNPVFSVANFVQSRNRYRKHRVFASRTSYTPLMPGIFEGVKGPMLS